MPQIFWDVAQGSSQWFRLRAGVPTASDFHHIMTPKKMELAAGRRSYACRLVAQRLLNWQAQSLDTLAHIQEAKENEPNAIRQLEFVTGLETKPVGFVLSDDGRFGASPDRVVLAGERIDISVEAKCPTIPKQVEYLLYPEGDEYRVQTQGQLMVCEADKALLYAYHPRCPAYRLETGRDEAVIRKLRACLEQFSDELEALTETAKRLGDWQAFAEVLAPLDAELMSEGELANLVENPMGRGEMHRMGA